MKRIFVLTAVVTSIALVLGACSLGGPDGQRVVAYFEDVGDLVEGGQVQARDVEIGSIDEIVLQLDGGDMVARVEMTLRSGKEISESGASAVIRQTSLLGEQFVEIEASPADGRDPVTIPLDRTDKRVDVETFLGDLSALIGEGGLEDLNRFTHAQAKILEDRGEVFGETLTELERFTSVLADRRLDIGSAIDHLASSSATLATNQRTLDDFLDSLEDANVILAEEGDDLVRLFRSLDRFGRVNAKFLAKHERSINRGFTALRPILRKLASAQGELRIDITQLRTFLELFPKSIGGGPGGTGAGDYLQADAILCEALADCHTKGEKGDVPGQGS